MDYMIGAVVGVFLYLMGVATGQNVYEKAMRRVREDAEKHNGETTGRTDQDS